MRRRRIEPVVHVHEIPLLVGLVVIVVLFAVAVGSIVGGEVGLLPIAGPLAAAAGIPLGTIVAMVVSALTPAPSRHALELVRDIRVPGGEILYDREMQRLRLKQRRSAA